MFGPLQEAEIKKRISTFDKKLTSNLTLYYTTFYKPYMPQVVTETIERKICGALNKHGKPCSRIGKCPFHKKKSTMIAKGKKIKKKKGWSKREHLLFLKGLQMHGKCWHVIARLVKSKSAQQIQSHANRYYQRQAQGEKKNKSIHDFDLAKLEELEVIFENICKDMPSERDLEQSRRHNIEYGVINEFGRERMPLGQFEPHSLQPGDAPIQPVSSVLIMKTDNRRDVSQPTSGEDRHMIHSPLNDELSGLTDQEIYHTALNPPYTDQSPEFPPVTITNTVQQEYETASPIVLIAETDLPNPIPSYNEYSYPPPYRNQNL